MVLGYGLFLPASVMIIIARTLKGQGPFLVCGFRAHIACNLLGLLLATVDFGIALGCRVPGRDRAAERAATC